MATKQENCSGCEKVKTKYRVSAQIQILDEKKKNDFLKEFEAFLKVRKESNQIRGWIFQTVVIDSIKSGGVVR